MKPEERAAHLEWCRAFIDHRAIFRSPPGPALLTSYAGGRARWQMYLPVATLDQEFMQRIALLFWDRHLAEFQRRPFQLCGCESGGVPLVCSLQAAAYRLGFSVNAFEVKKAQKTYGLKNWLEGIVIKDMPVLMVDDVVGAGLTLRTQAKRLAELGLEVTAAWCILAGNVAFNPPKPIKLGKRTIPIMTFFGPDHFAMPHQKYVAKYGRPPQFQGAIR